MISTIPPLVTDDLIAQFFRHSVGQWSSERRYYTLPDGKVQEMVSDIVIRFLEPGCAELVQLAGLHGLAADVLTCGAEVSWNSQNSILGKQMSEGTTLFGILDGVMYRDRGFATTQPITAALSFTNPDTMCLRTEYNGSVFEEEIRLIGQKYRTRQTVISRAGEQQMIGQYLEKRVS
jgi:CpeS-like protein